MEEELSRLQAEFAARDAVSRARADEMQTALEDATRGRTSAEATVKSMSEATQKAADDASATQASLEASLGDLTLARGEVQTLQESLDDARAALEASREEGQRLRDDQSAFESGARQSSERLAEAERLLEEMQARASQAETESLRQMAEMTHAAEGYAAEVAAVATRADQAEASAAAQRSTLRESLDRVAELEDALQVVRAELQGEIMRNRRLAGCSVCVSITTAEKS